MGCSHRSARGVRVGLFGEFGIGNLGNDASLEAVLAILARRVPEARLTCITRNPQAVCDRFGVQSKAMGWYESVGSRWSWLPGGPGRVLGKLLDVGRTAAQLAQLDVVIIPGTGIFEDYRVSPWQAPFTLARLGVLSRLTRTKLLLVDVGAEPATTAATARFFRWAATCAVYRSYRDDYSREALAGIGVDTSTDAVHADVAFSLVAHPAAPPAPTPVALVGIMTFHGRSFDAAQLEAVHERYRTTMRDFVCQLSERGYQVRLICADAFDIQTAEWVAQQALRAGCAPVEVVVPADMQAMLAATAQAHIVLATRYHQLIAAFLQQRPTLSVQYAPKNGVLMADAGAAQFSVAAESVDLSWLMAQVVELERNIGPLTEQIGATAAQYRSRLAKQEDTLVAVITAQALATQARSA